MTINTSYQVENNLIGTIVDSSLSTSSLTLYVKFKDPNTRAIVEPNSGSKLFSLKNGEDYEQILASSLSYAAGTGVTTVTIASTGRKYDEVTLTGSATGDVVFPIGSVVGMVTTGAPTNILKKIVEGTYGTGGTTLRIGDETAADISLTFQNDQGTKPKIYLDDSNQSQLKGNRGSDEGAAGDFAIGQLRLTTAERDALTDPLDGMTIFNVTTGVMNFREAGAWVENAAGGSVTDATTSAAGKVEIADDTESDAGDDSGSTGATTVVPPSQLARTVRDSKHTYAADTGAANAYVVTLVPAPSAYVTGMVVRFKAANANTTTSTINVNTLGAKTIKKDHDVNLEAGDIEANQMVTLIYDGTDFEMVSQKAIDLTSANKAILQGGATTDASTLHVHKDQISSLSFTLFPSPDPGSAQGAGFSDATTKLISACAYIGSTSLDAHTASLEVSNDIGSAVFVNLNNNFAEVDTTACALYIGTDYWTSDNNGTAGNRIQKNGTNVTIVGSTPSASPMLGHDVTNSYLLVLDSTTRIRRYSGIAGTTITNIASDITLATAIDNTVGFLYDNTNQQYIAVDTTNNLIRRFSSTGTAVDTVAYTINDTNVKGVCFIKNRVYLIVMYRTSGSGSTTTHYQFNVALVPTNMTR